MAIDVKGLDDSDGAYQLVFSHYFAGNLTIKVLYSLVYILKDHKQSQMIKKIVPVSQCIYCSAVQ